MTDATGASVRARWGRLRFMVIGSLLADPPQRGQLQQRIADLAQKQWEDPTTGQKIQRSSSCIERWFRQAKASPDDPLEKLARKIRKDVGTHPTVSSSLAEFIAEQYRDHPTWSYKLHRDNLVAAARKRPSLGKIPSQGTISRFMKERGLLKQKRKRKVHAHLVIDPREKRSWEVRYVNQLWHLDFHEGSRCVLMDDGQWLRPWLLGTLDDHSRLACHVQWYLVEDSQNLVHGLSQALQKRGVCAALLTDGGGAMRAAETSEGLMRLGIVHDMTLPYTPEQNGKQESFWNQIEGRLLPMLEGVPHLTLRLLNDATQAWVEQEYNQAVHSETGCKPIDLFLTDHNIGRPCPSSERLRDVFRLQQSRKQRRSDGTISVQHTRFELPSRYRALQRVTVRYARWDMSNVDLIDPRSERILCPLYPLDKQRNADQARRTLEPVADPALAISEQPRRPSGIAPLLRELMADYAASGLPPAYLPKDELPTEKEPA
jgi:putative transposase